MDGCFQMELDNRNETPGIGYVSNFFVTRKAVRLRTARAEGAEAPTAAGTNATSILCARATK